MQGQLWGLGFTDNGAANTRNVTGDVVHATAAR
jgi:hypothetical protein